MQPTNKKPGDDHGPKLQDRHAATPPDSSRILDNLARGGAQPSSALATGLRWRARGPRHAKPGWRGALAAALALLAGAAAWTSYNNGSVTAAPGKRDIPVTVIAPTRQTPPQAAAKAAPATVEPETRAAAIIDETATPVPAHPRQAAAATAPVATAATPATPATLAAASAPVSTGAHSAASGKTKHAASATSLAADAAGPAQRPVPSAARKPNAASARKQTAAAKSGGATAAAAGKAPADTDVALLTAVVAHASNQTAPAAATSGAAPQGEAEPNRDVVQRLGQESTASLLERCQQLGEAEGRLCRSRICSGRWGADAACH